MKQSQDFFDFEINKNFFDLEDGYGKNPWDAVRYYVYNNKIISNQSKRPVLSVRKSFPRLHLYRIIRGLFYFLTHLRPNYLFIICSRDNKANNVKFDKISCDLVNLVDKKRSFFIETCPLTSENCFYPYICPQYFIALWNKIKIKKYDFSDIVEKLKMSFPDIDITKEDLDVEYRKFIIQYKYFKFLIRLIKPRQIFLVQNGIHKGLFAAANELGVEIVEFQHGQISFNHMAYSYPMGIDGYLNKIYHPNKLLIFGEYWAKNRCFPGVQNVVIGNNYYASDIVFPETSGNKQIVVISNDIEGPILSELVRKIIKIAPDFYFYFKLHPNQIRETRYYYDLFESYENVEVVFDEYNINQLLVRAEAILLIQSTTELEALQAGRKVFVLKEGAYEVMDFVFNEEGVFLFEDAEDFVDCYNRNVELKLSIRDDIFSKFDKGKALAILK